MFVESPCYIYNHIYSNKSKWHGDLAKVACRRHMNKSIKNTIKKIAKDYLKEEKGELKQAVYIKLDTEVIRWFRNLGPGYQGRINEVLKRFVAEINQQEPSVLALAQELFSQYYTKCFWHMKSNLIVTEAMLPEIVKGLKTYGGKSGYMEAIKLCQ